MSLNYQITERKFDRASRRQAASLYPICRFLTLKETRCKGYSLKD